MFGIHFFLRVLNAVDNQRLKYKFANHMFLLFSSQLYMKKWPLQFLRSPTKSSFALFEEKLFVCFCNSVCVSFSTVVFYLHWAFSKLQTLRFDCRGNFKNESGTSSNRSGLRFIMDATSKLMFVSQTWHSHKQLFYCMVLFLKLR